MLVLPGDDSPLHLSPTEADILYKYTNEVVHAREGKLEHGQLPLQHQWTEYIRRATTRACLRWQIELPAIFLTWSAKVSRLSIRTLRHVTLSDTRTSTPPRTIVLVLTFDRHLQCSAQPDELRLVSITLSDLTTSTD